MIQKVICIFIFAILSTSSFGQTKVAVKQLQNITIADSLKKSKETLAQLDSLKKMMSAKFTPYKTNVHASYYHNKFNGRATASGVKFNNEKYTAAHRKFPFGTKLKVTNLANGKSVSVEVLDRGPFTRGREIDLTRRAFMDIADNKNSGSLQVKIEVQQ